MEIERKFLINTLPDMMHTSFQIIQQAYISIEPVIRIRQADDKYFLTMKSKGHIAREEYELEITESAFKRLLEKREGIIIVKKRYFMPLSFTLTAELDIFEGDLAPLMTVEVEFPNHEAALDFTPPDWFGQDISFDKRYKNNYLAINGLPK